MKKWQSQNSETSEILEISEIPFQVFLFLRFRFFPTSKIENLDLKIFEVFKFSIWPNYLVAQGQLWATDGETVSLT